MPVWRMTAETMPNICPRCGRGFECGMAGDRSCACTTVTLDQATLARLRQQYDGCLCLACLVLLNESSARRKCPPWLAN